jgi:hypothetical protein
MTRETSSIASSSSARSCADVPIADLDDVGGPYTLGNEGAVAEDGLELPPVSPVDVVGDSGTPLEASVMREREIVKSSDWARFCSERGLEICSFSFASSRESEPLLRASSECLVR